MQTHTIHHPYSVPKGISSRPTHLGVRNGLFGSARGHENSGRPFASGGVPSGGTQKKIRHANKISHSHLPPSPIPCRPSPSPGGRRQAPPFPLLRPLPFSFTSLRPSLSPRSGRAALPWCWQKGIRMSSGRMGSGRRGSGRRGPGRAMASWGCRRRAHRRSPAARPRSPAPPACEVSARPRARFPPPVTAVSRHLRSPPPVTAATCSTEGEKGRAPPVASTDGREKGRSESGGWVGSGWKVGLVGVRGVSDGCAVGPGRPKAPPNLGHKWVAGGPFVCLGSPAGSSFTHFFVRADTFGPRVVEWVAPLEMP
jgi:hypothetical protein